MGQCIFFVLSKGVIMEKDIDEAEEREARRIWSELQKNFFCEKDCPRPCDEDCLFYFIAIYYL